ncbi:MAG: efflux RND transporter permease subunit [Campylobacterales bacterium]|nr:efflux RND transporter permease subunit [Campylobacterales bacterium]
MIKFSIKNPVTIIVTVLIAVMFGFLSLGSLAYQLTPNVTKPEITVTTIWPGATPYEIETEIIEEQEKTLKSLNNLVSYESSSKDNRGEIKLKFTLETDPREALLDVSNKLNEVPSYPQNVDQPIIRTATASPVIWMMLQTTDENKRHINEYKTFLENDIREHLDRIDDVADLMIMGGTKKEMHITVDKTKLAAYNITINSLIQTIQSENIDISAGIQNINRKSYRIRTVSKFKTIDDIKNVVLKSDPLTKVVLGDVASVEFGYEQNSAVAMFLGKDGIFMGVKPTSTANIVALTNEVERVVNNLNETILKDKQLKIKWIYDQRPYIVGAVELVKQNIAIGGILAVVVLLLFLRAISPTAVVGMAIPISVIATFTILEMMGRSLNTISLAGISFAVGMLVDSAIVVLENIDRHRKMGKSIYDAAYDGTNEVWGALIASASTTMAVFLPIIFLQDEAGQLFKDIAIAVVASVTFSLFVSISVIPMMWKQLSKLSKKEKEHHPSPLTNFGDKIVDAFMAVVKFSLKSTLNRLTTIITLAVLSVGAIYLLFPKMEYLPQGNRNLIFNILIPPPGLSYQERYEMGEYLMDRVKPYVGNDKDGFPAVNRLFYVSEGDFIIFGGTSKYEDRAKELIPMFSPIINSLPSVFGVSVQAGVFESGIGEGRTVNVDISGQKIEEIANVGGMMFGAIREAMQGSQVRPVPSIELLYPEVRIIPNKENLKTVGMSSSELGVVADVLMNGRKIGDFQEDGKKKIDLVIKANEDEIQTPLDIYNSQISTNSGELVPFSELSSLKRTTGISEIRHYNGSRTITLQVTPPPHITIQEAIEIIKGGVLPKLEQSGMLNGVEVKLSGTADKLTTTIDLLAYNFILALVIIYLLMAALFGNFIYPLVIMFTVPLATAGGFIGLKLTDAFLSPQPLDVLTMLGFIILVGIVVNNAILIVHQSLNLIRNEAMEHYDAVVEATKSRIRPIYMSSLTSIFGMLPLVLAPGPGSEFYRGLGSVITGGLTLSTIFTIFVTPALLMFFIKMEKIKRGENEIK